MPPSNQPHIFSTQFQCAWFGRCYTKSIHSGINTMSFLRCTRAYATHVRKHKHTTPYIQSTLYACVKSIVNMHIQKWAYLQAILFALQTNNQIAWMVVNMVGEHSLLALRRKTVIVMTTLSLASVEPPIFRRHRSMTVGSIRTNLRVPASQLDRHGVFVMMCGQTLYTARCNAPTQQTLHTIANHTPSSRRRRRRC